MIETSDWRKKQTLQWGPGRAFFKKIISDKFPFFKWANPASFIVYFRSFQTNIITIFTTNICEKMSI